MSLHHSLLQCQTQGEVCTKQKHDKLDSLEEKGCT
jgi:hypothetical protein